MLKFLATTKTTLLPSLAVVELVHALTCFRFHFGLEVGCHFVTAQLK